MSQSGTYGSGGGGAGTVQFLAGNSGGNVGPDGLGVINVVGSGSIDIIGNPGTNTLTVSLTGGGLTWTEVIVGGPTAMAVNNGYIANNGATVQLTLPATAALGSIIRVSGKGAGGWQIQQNAGQTIYFGGMSTTTGALGTLSSTVDRDAVELVCVTADIDFNVISSVGNLAVV
jgi:hypothetical protein